VERRLSYRSSAAPEAVLRALEQTVASLPSSGRVRPAHVARIRAKIDPPDFMLECERNYRDVFGPVCIGTVRPEGSGSSIRVRLRRGRGIWFIPAFAVILTVIGWIRRGGPTIGSIILLAAVIPLIVFWPMLISLFATSNHEAEADALDAVLRLTINRAENGAAVA
jgi:hypothetical protein